MLSEQIWLCGDVHGDLRTLRRALAQAAPLPQAIILVGDLDPPEPVGAWLSPVTDLGIDTWFIHGNHETDSDAVFLNMFHSPGAQRNFSGRVVELAGLRVAGLGGVFREEVWYPPTPPHFADYDALYDYWLPRTPRHQRAALPALAALDERPIFNQRLRKHHSSIFPDVYHRLADQSADVLIVHEAPSCHPNGFEAIDLLAQTMGVRWVVHGHHHDALDYRAHRKALGFEAIGVGFRGITTLAGEIIVSGEFDDRRANLRRATTLPPDQPIEGDA
jgi:predicted phosphodiesterase